MTSEEPFLDGEVGRLPLRDQAGNVVAWATVDAADLSRFAANRWSRHPLGYVVRRELRGGRHVYLYLGREVLGLPASGSPRIRYINGDGLDCRRDNLRISITWLARMLKKTRTSRAEIETALARVGVPR